MQDERARLTRALARPLAASSDFDLNPDLILPPERKLRAAAVLVPIAHNGGNAQVILTKRASHLKHHPGQIAFPGGKIDSSDISPTAAALREAYEEIGLAHDRVDILGALAPHETITGFQIIPILGHIRDCFNLNAAPNEVAEIFTVPLSYITNLDNFRIESRIWAGVRRYFYVVPYGPNYIWGATARILHAFARQLQP